jgi:Mor family transcriptional regulator
MKRKMVESGLDARRHELLADMAEQTSKFLMEKHGIEQDVAIDAGNNLADHLCDHWKGQNIYFAADTQYKLSKRDLEIFERMQRGNAPDLAMEYGVSFVRIYQIYRRCLAALRARQQPSLFDAPTTELSTGSEQEPLA